MFDSEGKRMPVTHISAAPCYLIDVKWTDVNGYAAVTLGIGTIKNIGKSVKGQLKKAGIEAPLRFLKEIRIDDFASSMQPIEENGKKGLSMGETKLFVGDVVNPAAFFKAGDLVDVSGTSKGKGFQGVVKRHNFRGGPKTHGQSDRHRAPGSMGQTTTPGRVYRGKRMAGRMGGDRITVKNLPVIEVSENGMVLKGLIPGGTEGYIEVRTHKG